jgi:hypothetical protein
MTARVTITMALGCVATPHVSQDASRSVLNGDIYELAVDAVYALEHQETLKQLSLTSRQFHDITVSRLFRHLAIRSATVLTKKREFDQLLEFCKRFGRFARLVERASRSPKLSR